MLALGLVVVLKAKSEQSKVYDLDYERLKIAHAQTSAGNTVSFILKRKGKLSDLIS